MSSRPKRYDKVSVSNLGGRVVMRLEAYSPTYSYTRVSIEAGDAGRLSRDLRRCLRMLKLRLDYAYTASTEE